MKQIPLEQVLRNVRSENPWWAEPHAIHERYQALRRRSYFDLLYPLLTDASVRRAVLLMGPRRVGKTVLIHHAIQQLIDDGVPVRNICYVSVDHPIYNTLGLLDLVERYAQAAGVVLDDGPRFVFFDEVQYVRDWEVHLKVLVDSHPEVRFVASGSAAAALRLRSIESGAGRFTDFLLPPLTFHEYLELLGKNDLIGEQNEETGFFSPTDLEALNAAFVHYLNFGGYPEVIFSEAIQADPARFIKSDIIDKVLLRDLPGLYGIQDIQELNYLFTTLAFNTANEVSLDQLSKSSGVAKNTIKRYIEYLEAAFLIKIVHRIDRSGRRFQRANFFKVYLTNPSMRAALFSPVGPDDEAMGDLAETGIFSQWFHTENAPLNYARWRDGEVDIVNLRSNLKPLWAVEVKWSDRPFRDPHSLHGLLSFCNENKLKQATVTSKNESGLRKVGVVELTFVPASVYCYTVGFNIIANYRKIRQRGTNPENPT